MISGSSPSRSEPRTPSDMAQLLTIVENLCQHNESLQESVHTLQQMQSTRGEEEEEELLDFKPILEEIGDDQVPENFKPPLFPSFDGKNDPQEHIISIKNQMTIIGTSLSVQFFIIPCLYNICTLYILFDYYK